MSRLAINANVEFGAEKTDLEFFTKTLNELRKKKSKSIEVFAYECGVSVPTFYKYMKDPDSLTIGRLRQIRNTLGVCKSDFTEIVSPLL